MILFERTLVDTFISVCIQIIVHFLGFIYRLLVSAWFLVRGFEKKMFTKIWIKLIFRFLRYAQVPPIILILAPCAFELLNI